MNSTRRALTGGCLNLNETRPRALVHSFQPRTIRSCRGIASIHNHRHASYPRSISRSEEDSHTSHIIRITHATEGVSVADPPHDFGLALQVLCHCCLKDLRLCQPKSYIKCHKSPRLETPTSWAKRVAVDPLRSVVERDLFRQHYDSTF